MVTEYGNLGGEKMVYKNLSAEMTRFRVSRLDLGSLLGCSEGTVKNKLNGKSDFSYPEARTIQRKFFPGMKLEYLFDDGVFDPDPPERIAWKRRLLILLVLTNATQAILIYC